MHEHESQGPLRVVTVTMSDTRKRSNDESGDTLAAAVKRGGLTHVRHVILREEPRFIQELVRLVAVDNEAEAVIVTGGTGISPRDRTFEALEEIFDKRIDGFGETFRRLSWDEIGPTAILSRATAGIVDEVLVFSLPGNPKAVELGVNKLILPVLKHSVDLARGRTAHSVAMRVD